MNPTAVRDSIHQHPFAFSTIVVAAFGGIDVLLKVLLVDLLSLSLPVATIGIISGFVVSVLGAFVVRRLGLWRELGFIGRPASTRPLLWFIPFLLYGLLPLTAGPDVSGANVAAVVACGLLIAFWKLVVLALVLFSWLPRGLRSAAAITAAMWSGMHLIFGILAGNPALPTLVLAISYAFLAFAFVAVRLRTGLLWPLMPCYGMFLAAAASVQGDEASNLATSVADLLAPLVVSALLGLYSLIAWPRRSQQSVGGGPGPGRPHPSDGMTSNTERRRSSSERPG